MDDFDTSYLIQAGRSIAWHLPDLPREGAAKRRSTKALVLDLCSGTPEIIPALSAVLDHHDLHELSSITSELARRLKLDAIIDSLRESYSARAIEATSIVISAALDSLTNLRLGTKWKERDIQNFFDEISLWNDGSLPASPRALRKKVDDSFDPLVAAALHIPLVWLNRGLDRDDEEMTDITLQVGFLLGFIVESVLRRRQRIWKGNRQLLAYHSKVYEAKSLLSESGAAWLQSCFTEETIEEVILPCEFLIEVNLFDADFPNPAAIFDHLVNSISFALVWLLKGDLEKAKSFFKSDAIDIQDHIRNYYYRDLIESKDYWLPD